MGGGHGHARRPARRPARVDAQQATLQPQGRGVSYAYGRAMGSPVSPDSALGQLAQRVSALEQKVHDQIASATERLADLTTEVRRIGERSDQDYRSFAAPAVRVQSELEHLRGEIEDIKHDFEQDLGECRTGIQSLRDSFAELERVRAAREEREREQERLASKEDRRDKWSRRLGMAAILVAIGSSTASILVALLA